MNSLLPGLLSGAAFGAALTASGVYQPSVIVSQLRLQDWHMLRVFLTSVAGSGIVAAVLQSLGFVKLSPRNFSSLGLFGRADANVIGGALLGAGMALAGACPGTVATQVAVGINSGYWGIAGGVLGGLVYTGLVRKWVSCGGKAVKADGTASRPIPLTIYENLGVSYLASLVVFEIMLGAVIKAAAAAESTTAVKLSPIVGGLCIVGAQLFSVLSRKCLMGASTFFEEVGDYFWWLTSTGENKKRWAQMLKSCSTVFVAGIMLGSRALALAAPTLVDTKVTQVISPLNAALGGFTMVLGARVAGGCTSGHGISGVSLLSVSSILTIGTALATGAVVAQLLY